MSAERRIATLTQSPAWIDGMANTIVRAITLAVTPLRGRLEALERDVADLKARPCVKFTGVYSATLSYVPGDAATREGGLWICTAHTTGAFNHSAWRLAVKRGNAG